MSLIQYISNAEFMEKLFLKSMSFVMLQTNSNFYEDIYCISPYGDLRYPTPQNPCYAQFVEWSKLSFSQKMICPPIFYA
jgi:hypothetical protein